MLKPILCFLLGAALAGAGDLNIPSATGPLTIDGRIDEQLWQGARVLPLATAEFGAPLPEGGETRLVVRGAYLCVSARLPEQSPVVARSTGRNPVWWKEDQIAWAFRVRPSGGRNRTVTLSVNPLGAYRLDYGGEAQPEQSSDAAMAAATISANEWSAEAAVAIEKLGEVGLLSVERVRVERPDAPELHWYWPAANERAPFALRPDTSTRTDLPSFRPAALASESTTPVAQSTDKGSAELPGIPHRVWSDEDQKRLGIARMVEKNLRERALETALKERRDWEEISTRADWERFRDQRVDALKASFGTFPERTPLRAAVTRRADHGDGFVLENIVFESRPGLLVTANLYLPEKISGRIPAVVLVHSHHAPKVQSELQDMGMTWARTGAAVLVMDQLGAGERLQSQPWPRESYYSRYAMGMQLHLAGESLMKWMVWDLVRGIDLLLEQPYIDPRRVVMIGAVAGGGDPAAVTAVLDERIAAVVPFNFGEAGPEEHYLEGPRGYDFETAWPGWGDWETTRSLRRSIADQFFPWLICASVAPRGFIYSFEMAWPNDVERQPAWARYKRVFDLYGQRDRLHAVDGFGPFPGPGECTNVGVNHRKKIYPILKRWLDIPVPSQEYHNPRPEKELMCFTPAVAAERKPKAASEIALEMAEQRLAATRARLSSLPVAERRLELGALLKVRLGDIEPRPQAEARVVWSKSYSGHAVEAVTLETDPGITLPLLLLKPTVPGASSRLPVVIGLGQGGKERFLSERGGEVAELLRSGVAVCLPDLRGVGETAWSSDRGPSNMILAVVEQMLGGTMLGSQLKDARTVLRYVSARKDVDSKRIVLWGDSFAATNPRQGLLDRSLQQPGPQSIHQAEPLGGLLALLAALYEDGIQAVAARGSLVSYLSVLKDRFCYVPEDVIVPGILEAADLGDVVASLAPRAVLIEGFVDGRNRVVPEQDLKTELGPALAAYRASLSQLIVREQPARPQVAAWLAAQCRREGK